MFTRRSASVLIFFCLPLFAQLLSAFGYSQVGRISGPAAQATGRLLPPLGTISGAQPSRGSEASLLPAALSTPPIFQLPPVYSLLSSPFQGGAFVLADVNGDGIPDVVAAGNVSSYDGNHGILVVLLGNGDGTFQAAKSFSTGEYSAAYVAVGDVNGDGKPDVLVSNVCATVSPIDYACEAPGEVTLFLGDGTGNFTSSGPVGPSPIVNSGKPVYLADLNGDGKLDLIAISADEQSIEILLGNGDGTFQSATTYATHTAISVFVTDVNLDGKLDLIVGNQCGITNCSSATAGVLLGNGNGTFQAAVSYQTAFQLEAVADVNGDGKPDLITFAPYGSLSVYLGNGNGTFQPALTSNVGGYASVTAVADMNGDHKPDLIGGDGDGNTVVLLGNGNGTFQPPLLHYYPGAAATVADVNGDGKLDVVEEESTGIAVLFGNGDGTLLAAAAYNDGDSVQGGNNLAVGDLNGDGKPDLIISNYCAETNCAGATVSVLLNNGNGTFKSPVAYTAGYDTYSVATADLNGDGNADIIVANGCASGTNCNTGLVGVLLNKGGGTFQTIVTYGSGGYFPTQVLVADVNGDGKPDLLVLNQCMTASCPKPSLGSVGVLLGNGDGTFKPVVTFTAGYVPDAFAVADVNGDGKPDLLVANFCDSAADCSGPYPTPGLVSVLLGDGDGTFQQAVSYGSGGIEAMSLAVGDINGDGKPDLVVGNQDGMLGLLLGNGNGTFQTALAYGPFAVSYSAPALADFNGDGKLDVALPGVVLLGNGDGTFQTVPLLIPGGAIVASDLNGDGRPDLAIAGGNEAIVLLNIFSASNPANVTLTSSVNPAAVSQAVTFTASVAGSGATPTGSVTFQNGGVVLGTVPLSGGVASFNKTFVAVGTRSITATYSGNLSYAPGASAVLSEGIGGNPTTTALTASFNPALVGQYVTFTATVSSGFGSPTGTIAFVQNGTRTLGTVPLSGGQAVVNLAFGSPNTKSITAVYSGSTQFAVSTSAAVNEVVGTTPATPTTTGVISSMDPSPVGESVTFTATVSSSSGTPSGNVVFMNGSNTIGTVALSGGQATLAKVFPSVGNRSISALYLGGGSYASSASQSVEQSVIRASTTTTLTSSLDPSVVGQTVSFTATVTPQFGGTPNGTITFMNGAIAMATVPLSNGQAVLNRAFASDGTKSITAVYSGDANFTGSTSAAVSQQVAHATTTTTLTSSPNPSTVGQSVTLTATVAPQFGGTPTGTVTFMNGTVTLGTVPLSGGQATFNKTFVASGMRSLSAIYSGDANYTTSTGTTMQTVN